MLCRRVLIFLYFQSDSFRILAVTSFKILSKIKDINAKDIEVHVSLIGVGNANMPIIILETTTVNHELGKNTLDI